MPKELSYSEASGLIRQRGFNIIAEFNRYISQTLGEKIEVREHFALDGAVLLPHLYLQNVSPALQRFFNANRKSLANSIHAYQDESQVPTSGIVAKNTTNYTALRGERFYVFDGKFNIGPDGVPALSMLTANLADDALILPQLAQEVKTSKNDWLLSVAAWDYIRNDVAAAYYLKRCQHALDSRPEDVTLLGVYEHALERAYTGYYAAFTQLPVEKDLTQLAAEVELIKRDTRIQNSFVEKYANLDLIRSHRELGNPQALMFAAHLLFATDRLQNVDLIVAPLFGAIDLDGALQFLYNHGNSLYQQVTGNEFRLTTKPPLVKLLHKISPRGTPRSQMPGLMDALPQTIDVLDREEMRVKEKISQAHRILIIDDSVGTFASEKKISEFIRTTASNGHAQTIDFVAAHGGVRWAEAQHASRTDIVNAESMAVTPLTHTFKKPVFSWGSAYLPDAEIARRLLYSTRTVMDFSELKPLVKNGFEHGVIAGVGFDLYETLVKRTVERSERRRILHELGASVFAEYGYSISPDEYGTITRPVWLAEQAEKGQSQEEINYFETVSDMVRAVFVKQSASYSLSALDGIVRKICANELQFELETTVADEGVLETLKQFQHMGIPLGIYSNTPYLRTDMIRIIKQTGISQFIPLENMLFSSETGIIKPSSKTIDLLASTMRVQKSNLAFVGNSLDDIRAAANARAIPVLRIFEKEHPNLQKRLIKWRKANTDYEARNS